MQRRTILASLSEDDAYQLLYDWPFWARPEQRPPLGDWVHWAILAGRGFGKTRTGAETVRHWARHYSLVNLIGPTADDARDVMVQGESGILAICPSAERPVYRKSERKLIWPNGAESLIFTADEPERLRGKQHEKLWADEFCAWRYANEAFDQAMLGLRLGNAPQAIWTTTPRPIKPLRELLADPATVVTRGTTYDNRANLATAFFSSITKKYEGTRLGRQELLAEILEDTPGALWKRANIDMGRVVKAPQLDLIIVGVDPSATSTGDEAGVVTVGGTGGEIYTLGDDSLQGSPVEWARAAVTAYHRHNANYIAAESNQGGEMVTAVIATVDPTVPVRLVHASRGKATRAEPVAALYEQGRAHHVGAFPALEDEMCMWTPGDASPNRMDALVWAATKLMTTRPVREVRSYQG
jgi:phage terminase large subunit-like protein